MAAADVDQHVKAFVEDWRSTVAELTSPEGPFPLAREEVQHYGTTQSYLCWQRGPNSLVFRTLPELYGDSFTRLSGEEFLVFEGERCTYGEAIEIAAALARELWASYNITRGKCVAIAARNYPEWVFSLLAVTGFLSAVALPVNSWWMDEELRYGLVDSQTDLLVADLERVHRAPFLNEIGVRAICMRAGAAMPPNGVARFEDVVAAGRKRVPLPTFAVDQDDRTMLMYTSGTTNKPKGVVLTQRSIMTAMNALRFLQYFGKNDAQHVGLLASPLFHVNGSHVALLGAICDGAKLVLMYKWDAQVALKLVQSERVQYIVGVPTNTYDLVNHPDFDKYDTSSMVSVGGGGAAFAAPMIKKVGDKFKNAKASTGYGLTETNALTVTISSELFALRPTSCGGALPNVEVCILGENDETMPVGEVGEICLRGASVMKEYWQKPDKTAEVFHIDGQGQLWFRSGDVGRLDADGFIYIMDRAKDIIIRGGENISCAEVEAALFDHPSVAEVAAIGIPHETLGETVAVAIVFVQGVPAIPMNELKKHAADRLAAFKVPSDYFIWDGQSLPRGATGKIQKREIKAQVTDSGKKFSKL